MSGIASYGVYVPHFRLQRKAIGAALGSGGGKGTRAVASYDEDSVSMAVEAGRRALRTGVAPDSLTFATARPPYLEKTNATAVHAALALPSATGAYDAIGSVRSGVHVLLAALASPEPALAITSDVRFGLPGGADERDGGDAAAAFVCGPDSGVAELIGRGTATREFLERWRLPEETTAHVWEERFGEVQYVPLADEAFAAALKQAGLTPADVDHLVVAGTAGRAARAFARGSGVRTEALGDDLSSVVGNPGVAQPGLLLADALDRATPGQVIALVVLADGADALILRTTQALASSRAALPVSAQVAAGDDSLAYNTYLTWRGLLDREPPRRPDPIGPAAPVSARNEAWKFSLVGSRCTDCDMVHLPPGRVCQRCHAVDHMAPAPVADVIGTVVTFAIDRLAFSPSPPLIVAVIDFDGGGRFSVVLTDCTEAQVAIGMRVAMSFRRTVIAAGINNYFWKAVPA